MTDYQTAQSLVTKAQEIFDKNLKPISNVTNTNAEIEKDQLRNSINNKAPFMDIMKIVHFQSQYHNLGHLPMDLRYFLTAFINLFSVW
jgi:hypothetical protein